MTPESAGPNCTAGGQRIEHGIDDDRSGTLELGEIDGTSFVCNGVDGVDGIDGEDGVDGTDGVNGTDGTNGTNGVNSLVSVVAEPNGSNCL